MDRNVGTTAPKMTANAAEQWRQSYREYRQRKHAGKSNYRLPIFIINLEQANGAKSMPTISLDSTKLEPSLPRKPRSMVDANKSDDLATSINKNERKMFHKIKAIARPKSTQRHLSQQDDKDQVAIDMNENFEAPYVSFHLGKPVNGANDKEMP